MFGHAPANASSLNIIDLCVITFLDKFNGTVPGTFQHNIQQSTDPTGENITTVDSVSTTVTVAATMESTIEISVFAVGSTLFYVLICIIIFLSFTVVCALIGLSVQRKRKSHHRHARGMLYCMYSA